MTRSKGGGVIPLPNIPEGYRAVADRRLNHVMVYLLYHGAGQTELLSAYNLGRFKMKSGVTHPVIWRPKLRAKGERFDNLEQGLMAIIARHRLGLEV